MNNVIGRILTGICGGLVMAAINHWNSLQGWAYSGSIAAGFAVFFGAAVLFERRTSKKAGGGIGSHNDTQGKQKIEISSAAINPGSSAIGSGNKSAGDQDIKIG